MSISLLRDWSQSPPHIPPTQGALNRVLIPTSLQAQQLLLLLTSMKAHTSFGFHDHYLQPTTYLVDQADGGLGSESSDQNAAGPLTP